MCLCKKKKEHLTACHDQIFLSGIGHKNPVLSGFIYDIQLRTTKQCSYRVKIYNHFFSILLPENKESSYCTKTCYSKAVETMNSLCFATKDVGFLCCNSCRLHLHLIMMKNNDGFANKSSQFCAETPAEC